MRQDGLKTIAARRAARAAASAGAQASEGAAGPAAATLLDLLLNARDSEGKEGGSQKQPALSDDELLDNAVTFLLAGEHQFARASQFSPRQTLFRN